MKYAKFYTVVLVIVTQMSQAETSSDIPIGINSKPQAETKIQQHYFLQPKKIDEILSQLRIEIGDQRLRRALGEPTLKSLDDYSQMDANQINNNMYVAAAAGGAAAAVVEYVWDRVVGNGPKEGKFVRDDYFDVIGPAIPPTPRSPNLIRQNVGMTQPRDLNPVTITPAVASATVGAVAYKAAEYSLKKAFGEFTQPENFDSTKFDIQH